MKQKKSVAQLLTKAQLSSAQLTCTRTCTPLRPSHSQLSSPTAVATDKQVNDLLLILVRRLCHLVVSDYVMQRSSVLHRFVSSASVWIDAIVRICSV